MNQPVSQPRWRRLEPDKRREQILGCAVTMFCERPYAAVSTTELAARAGVARGLINHYFGTKRDLYLEVVRRMVTIPRVALDRLPGGSPAERIDEALGWFLDLLTKHGKAWLAAISAEGVGRDPDIDQILAEADELAADWVLAAAGTTDEVVDCEVLRAEVRAYGGMVKAAAREWLIYGRLTRDQVHQLLASTLHTILEQTAQRKPSDGSERTCESAGRADQT